MKTKSTFTIRTLVLALLIICSSFFSQTTNGSVGINTTSPNQNSVLDVVSNNNNKGVLIPRLTTAQRDAITVNTAVDDGLTIYNTEEDCFNYWSSAETRWKSICGRLGKAAYTYNCSSDVTVNGTYIKGKILDASNYLTITVTVTKPGTYDISATSGNGYNFHADGTFLTAGTFTVNLTGSGTPTNTASGCPTCGNTISITNDGVAQTCSPPVRVTVLDNAGTYTVSCGSATVNGVYTKGNALTASNTITLPVNVSVLGSYSISTNTVDGISFSVSGTFTSTGNQNVTLSGTGNPTSTADKVMTVTSNSLDGTSTCNVNVVMTIPVKKVLHIGAETVYGYSAFTGPSRSLMNSSTNFGTAVTSRVKSGGYTHTSLGATPSSATLLTALNSKPDIVIMGFPYAPDAVSAGYIANYLNNKGVVIAFVDNAAASQNLIRAIYSDPAISAVNGSGAGSVYSLSNTNDPVLNGPFGDVRGKNWGEDASATINLSGLTNGFISYSFAQPINDATTRTGITGLRHNSLHFIWFGDGGFLSNENANGNQYTSNTIEPFVAPSSGGYFPVEKSVYGSAGNGYAAGSMQVQNSIIFANALAWAIKQAETNGINTP
nr:hypothetical protein [uncultured Chryseobacterium sp.]